MDGSVNPAGTQQRQYTSGQQQQQNQSSKQRSRALDEEDGGSRGSGSNDSRRRSGKETNNVMYGVPLVAVLISGIALTGSVFLYFNSLQLQAEIDSLKSIVVGGDAGGNNQAATRHKDQLRHGMVNGSNSSGGNWSSPGLVQRFKDETERLRADVHRLNLWANFSSCLTGSDVMIGNYCFRFIDYELEFWKAEKFCIVRNGHLGYIENKLAWNKTITFMMTRGLQTVWTGLYKKTQKKWRYMNNHPATFTVWEESNLFDDGDDCAFIRSDLFKTRYRMYDGRCKRIFRPFFCKFVMEKNKKETNKVSQSTSILNR